MVAEPFLVLDQNVLRDRTRVQSLFDRCDGERIGIIVPDIAGFEWSRGRLPRENWRRGLEFLKSRSDLVYVSPKFTQLARTEIGSGKPSDSIVCPEATRRFRQILTSLAQQEPETLDAIEESFARVPLEDGKQAWGQHDEFKQMVIRAGHLIGQRFTPDDLAEMRRSPTEASLEFLTSERGVKFIFEGLQHFTKDPRKAFALSAVPSVQAAFMSGLAAMALHWQAFGGLESISASKVTNDFLDLAYAVPASFCLELVSDDKRALEMCRAITAGADFRAKYWSTKLSEIDLRVT